MNCLKVEVSYSNSLGRVSTIIFSARQRDSGGEKALRILKRP